MKTTRASVSLLAAAVLGLTACTVQVTPGLPGADGTSSAPSTASEESAGNESIPDGETPAPETLDPEAPASNALPELTGPDGAPIPYVATYSTNQAPNADLSTQLAAELAGVPTQLDGAVDENGYVTLLENRPEGAQAHWPMSWDGTEPTPVDADVPGLPRIDVSPGVVVSGMRDSNPDWTMAAIGPEGSLLALTSSEFEGAVAENPVLDNQDLWVFIVGDARNGLERFPLAGGEPEPFGRWAQIGDADFGVTALANTWSDPDLEGFEIHHLGRGLNESLVTGTQFVGEVTQLANSADVTAFSVVTGENSEPQLVVVDAGEAIAVELTGGVVSLDVAGRYVAWSQATTPEMGPVDQFLFDLDTGAITRLGLGAPSVTFPSMSDSHITWSLLNGDATKVVTATLP